MKVQRLWLIQSLFIVWATVLLLRLIYWQIIQSSSLTLQADLQHAASLTLPAPRGMILASDGFPLVGNADNFLFYVNPKLLSKDTDPLINLLDTKVSSDSGKLVVEAKSSQLSWLAISRSVSPETKKLIESLNLQGVGFEAFPIRLYPEGSPSAYITGFVGRDEHGLPKGYFGIEGYYERQLSGSPGKLVSEKDAFGLPIVIGSSYRIPPRSGDTVKTSIDRTVQFIAHQKLEEGIKKYQAASGNVTIMESKTGRILAMANLPGYDPNSYSLFDPQLYKNPIVSNGFEPGSTFKTIIMSAALDAEIVTPDTICTTCSGPAVIADKIVRNWDDQYYPQSTMWDVILHSDNVGMVYVVQKLGKKRTYDYLRNFGFGSLTGIDLQEEDSPPLRPDKQWYDIDLATTGFGQGIAVTPLQMTTAVNVIANRGILVKPKVVTEIISGSGVSTPAKPSPKNKVISPQAATKMTEMMVNAVNNGQVRYYKPEGYLVAGKTGTAQVAIEGNYSESRGIASFIGFAPADDPKFTMLVTLDEPKTSPWGSTTAAPLWFSIASELFRYYRIPAYNHLNP